MSRKTIARSEDRNSAGRLLGHYKLVEYFEGRRTTGASRYYRALGETRWTLVSHG